MRWQLKLAKDTAKTLLPFQNRLRAFKRRLTPYRSNPANDALALAQGLDQIAMLRRAGHDPAGRDVLEIGTGWVPIVPTLYFLAGARSILLTDIERLLDAGTIRAALATVAAEAERVGDVLGLAPDTIRSRLAAVAGDEVPQLLAQLRMDYRVPFDGASLQANSLDLAVSRVVLEHIPPAALRRLLADLRWALRPAGAMAHVIDNSDHWEHGDKTISRVNFLRFGDRFWRLTGINPQNYQNRLRHYEYLALFRDCGFDVAAEHGEVDSRALAAVHRLPVIPRYRGVPAEQLAMLTSFIVARRSAVTAPSAAPAGRAAAPSRSAPPAWPDAAAGAASGRTRPQSRRPPSSVPWLRRGRTVGSRS